MKHTEEYLQSKEVLKYPSKYHDRDVERAMMFVNGYEQALSIGAVGQSLPQDTDGCKNDRDKCSCKDWGGCPVD